MQDLQSCCSVVLVIGSASPCLDTSLRSNSHGEAARVRLGECSPWMQAGRSKVQVFRDSDTGLWDVWDVGISDSDNAGFT